MINTEKRKKSLFFVIAILILLLIVAAVMISSIEKRGLSPFKDDIINFNQTKDTEISLRVRPVYRSGYYVPYTQVEAEECEKALGYDSGFKPPEDLELKDHTYYFIEDDDGNALLKREKYYLEDGGGKELSIYFSDDSGEWTNLEYGMGDAKESKLNGQVMYIWGEKSSGHYLAVSCVKNNGLYFNIAVKGFEEKEFTKLLYDLIS